jgi:hypothetical protein
VRAREGRAAERASRKPHSDGKLFVRNAKGVIVCVDDAAGGGGGALAARADDAAPTADTSMLGSEGLPAPAMLDFLLEAGDDPSMARGARDDDGGAALAAQAAERASNAASSAAVGRAAAPAALGAFAGYAFMPVPPPQIGGGYASGYWPAAPDAAQFQFAQQQHALQQQQQALQYAYFMQQQHAAAAAAAPLHAPADAAWQPSADPASTSLLSANAAEWRAPAPSNYW